MTDRSDTVGLIGLGAMGSEIAAALLDGGHELVVHDVRAGALAEAAERGARACESARDVANRAGVVFACLPSPAVVREVADEVRAGSAVRTFIDLSTTGPAAVEVAAGIEGAGISYLDAPLTGGVSGARARKLTVLASGDGEVFDRVRPLLETFGEVILRVGPKPGQGQTAKLLNNLLSATALAVTSEALTLGRRAGLDPEPLLQAFNAGSGRNTATSAKFPNFVLDRSFNSGFRLELMLKDVRLCLDEARALGHPMILGSVVEQLWGVAAAELEEEADHTEIVRLFERWSGVEIRATAPAGELRA
ncbi:MAG TPA: NAD(P)-dependent oxidoreductase [Solirubrobacterales bacterium]